MGNSPVRVDTSLKQLVKPSGNFQYSMCLKKGEKNNGFDRNVIFMPQCKMKNASFFLNLRKRKLHVELKPDLYDLCGHLKLCC